MNEQKGASSVAPLFYIIQPEIQIKRSEQNNQEIFHSREVMVELPVASIEAEQEKTEMNPVRQEIQEEVKQLSSEFNIPVDIQAEAMKKIEELGASTTELPKEDGVEEPTIEPQEEREEPALVKEEAISPTDRMVIEDAQPDVPSEQDMEEELRNERKKNVRMVITRLARYPHVVPKPLCELMIQGEKVSAILESKRGELVRLRIGDRYQSISINDIEEIRIL